MKRKQDDRKKGASRMRELGYTLVQVWFDAREMEQIKKAWPGHGLATRLRRLVAEALDYEFHYR